MLTWKGKKLMMPRPQTKNYRQLTKAESRRIRLSKDELPNWLFNTKQSTLKLLILNRSSRLHLFIYMYISEKEAMNLRGNEGVPRKDWR